MNTLLESFVKHTDIANAPEDYEKHLLVTKNLPEPEWTKTIINSAVDYLSGTPKLPEVEVLFGKGMYSIIKEYVPPFCLLMLATEQITKDRFLECIMSHDPKVDRVILDFLPEDVFREGLDKANEVFWKAKGV